MYLKKYFLILFSVSVILGSALVFNLLFPLKYTATIQAMSKMYDLDPVFVSSVIHAESKFRKYAISHKNASGLMQLTEPTANWLAEELKIENYDYSRIFEPEINIKLGTYYLRKLLDRYEGNTVLALSAYNAGSGNVAKWLNNDEYSSCGELLDYIPFKETRNYVDRVDFNIKVYRVLLQIPMYTGLSERLSNVLDTSLIRSYIR